MTDYKPDPNYDYYDLPVPYRQHIKTKEIQHWDGRYWVPKKDVDQYKKCRECKHYEILQDPITGFIDDHSCVIYPDCIYEEEKE